jgi:hypothetical protein
MGRSSSSRQTASVQTSDSIFISMWFQLLHCTLKQTGNRNRPFHGISVYEGIGSIDLTELGKVGSSYDMRTYVSYFKILHNGALCQRFHRVPFLTLCVCVCVKNGFFSFSLKSTYLAINIYQYL